MRFPFPRTLASQLVVILIAVLIISQLVTLFVIMGERRLSARLTETGAAMTRFTQEAARLQLEPDTPLPHLVYDGGTDLQVLHVARVSQVERMRDANPDADAARQLRREMEAAGLSPITVEVGRRALDRVEEPPPRPRDARQMRDDVYRPGRPPDRNGPPPPGMEEVILSAEIEPGIWLNGQKTYYSVITVSYRVALYTGMIAIFSSLIVWLFARRVARPLRDLAISADKLGRGQSSDHVAEYGPEDVRKAAHAFNQMQERLTRLLETQRTMLRAVGHDLRTPLTSLRIRAESIPEEHGQAQIISTLDDMKDMTEEILRWAKESSGLEPVSPVDIGALLQSLTDDYSDMGHPVSFSEVSGPVVSEVRRVALRRAVQNLIDNALKYAGNADVSLEKGADYLYIWVSDNGPGIPPDRLEDITKPFVRLENSRSKETGGVGLGLAIVQSVVLAHGGELNFLNREEGGLKVEIRLPCVD